MDGFEFAKTIKGDPKSAQIPIIMITSRTADKHRNRAAELGVDRFLGKPYQEDELLQSLRSVMAEARHRCDAALTRRVRRAPMHRARRLRAYASVAADARRAPIRSARIPRSPARRTAARSPRSRATAARRSPSSASRRRCGSATASRNTRPARGARSPTAPSRSTPPISACRHDSRPTGMTK